MSMTSSGAQTFRDAKSPEEALISQNLCNDYFHDRTQKIMVNNHTTIGLEIWFGQVKSRNPLPNEHFIYDTGVFVGATNERGPGTYSTDPCYVGGRDRPVQGNICSGSAKMANGQNIILEEDIAPPGKYFNTCS